MRAMLDIGALALPLLIYALFWLALYWAIRLGVRHGMRDHDADRTRR
jgi:hypothetical protein